MDDNPLFPVQNGKIIQPRVIGFDSIQDRDVWKAIQQWNYDRLGIERFMAALNAQVFGKPPDKVARKWKHLLEAEQAKWAHCETCGKFMAPHASNDEHHVNEGYSSDPDVPPIFKHFCEDHCPICNDLDEQESQ